jgi:hypothetical protein
VPPRLQVHMHTALLALTRGRSSARTTPAHRVRGGQPIERRVTGTRTHTHTAQASVPHTTHRTSPAPRAAQPAARASPPTWLPLLRSAGRTRCCRRATGGTGPASGVTRHRSSLLVARQRGTRHVKWGGAAAACFGSLPASQAVNSRQAHRGLLPPPAGAAAGRCCPPAAASLAPVNVRTCDHMQSGPGAAAVRTPARATA